MTPPLLFRAAVIILAAVLAVAAWLIISVEVLERSGIGCSR